MSTEILKVSKTIFGNNAGNLVLGPAKVGMPEILFGIQGYQFPWTYSKDQHTLPGRVWERCYFSEEVGNQLASLIGGSEADSEAGVHFPTPTTIKTPRAAAFRRTQQQLRTNILAYETRRGTKLRLAEAIARMIERHWKTSKHLLQIRQ